MSYPGRIRVVLFDADGVLTLPEELFSLMYARSRGLDPQPITHFFKTEWPHIVTGTKDLKEVLAENLDVWQWDGTPEELLDYWFKTEDVRNDELIELIPQIRAKGTRCYLATDQERYRGEYMKNVMFKDVFDGHFISAGLGVTKNNPRFFEVVFEMLKRRDASIRSDEVLFFDDSEKKVNAAKSAGMTAYLYTGTDQVRSLLLG